MNKIITISPKTALLLLLIIIFFFGPLTQTNASNNLQQTPPEILKYLRPGESSIQMISVVDNNSLYHIFYFTNQSNHHPRPAGEIFYDRTISQWDIWGIQGILVTDEYYAPITDPELLKEIFLLEMGGYLQTYYDLLPTFVPADEKFLEDSSNLSNSLAADIGFVTQKLKSFLLTIVHLDTPAEFYAEALRLILITPDADSLLFNEFLFSVRDGVESGDFDTFVGAIEAALQVRRFSNNKRIREVAKKALNEMDAWEKKITPNRLSGEIFGVDASFANWLDLGALAISLIYIDQISAEKSGILSLISTEAHLGNISIDSELLLAIDQVIDESNNASIRRLELLREFVEDHANDLVFDLGMEKLKELAINKIWATYGTRLVGHYMAGAFASILLAFPVADILFGLNPVYENLVMADHSAKISLELNQILTYLKNTHQYSSKFYNQSADFYYKVAIIYNLSAIQWYKSYADTIKSARLLKFIGDLFSQGSWSQTESEFRSIAEDATVKTEKILINPEIFEYAISLAIDRAEILPPNSTNTTSTVLIFDSSGSMNELDASGKTKLQAAKNAGENILNIIEAENQIQSSSTNQVSIVDFNFITKVDTQLSPDIALSKLELSNLNADGGTGMPDGLKTGIDILSEDSSGGKPIVILLSDGMANIGHDNNQSLTPQEVKQQVLDQAERAGAMGICVYTVGFGVPGTIGSISGEASIDEELLNQIPQLAGCGNYYNAQNALELANVYAELRHVSTGNVLLQKSGSIAQNQTVDIGNVQVPSNQSLLLYTLNWPGSRLDPILTDPQGRAVDASYAGASVSSSNTIASVIVENPRAGDWRVAAYGADVPGNVTQYNAILSTRQGAVTPAPALGPGIMVLVFALAAGGFAIYAGSRRKQFTIKRSQEFEPAPTATLVGLSGPFMGRTTRMPASGLVIGRSASCNLRLADRAVSRHHARIRYAQGRWYLQDLGSSGGIYVNDVRETAKSLDNGDRIRIGSSEFEFRI